MVVYKKKKDIRIKLSNWFTFGLYNKISLVFLTKNVKEAMDTMV